MSLLINCLPVIYIHLLVLLSCCAVLWCLLFINVKLHPPILWTNLLGSKHTRFLEHRYVNNEVAYHWKMSSKSKPFCCFQSVIMPETWLSRCHCVFSSTSARCELKRQAIILVEALNTRLVFVSYNGGPSLDTCQALLNYELVLDTIN